MHTDNEPDPAHASYYVDHAHYQRLTTLSADWLTRTAMSGEFRPDPDSARDCAALIAAEAWLADTLDLRRWLDCYAAQCIYWIPATKPAGDPRREITHEIHDRRRLEDRVARIETGLAYSMIPPVRTTHVLGHTEMWQGDAGEMRARVSFIIDAYHRDSHRVLSGWTGYSLIDADDQWRIAVKQVNLIDADQPQGNNSFFL